MKFVFGKLHVLLLFSALLMANVSFAQEMTITGKVTDVTTKEPLVGATVVIAGTTNGTTTDFDGNYRLNVTKGQKLVYSFIGYKSQTLTVGAQSTINVAMQVETKGLDQVVVIGYGQVKKDDATGSVAVVGTDDFNKGAITSPQDLLVGKSAGVVITSNSGAPGSGATIRIRGGSSMSASNDPLIVIDGMPVAGGGISGSSNPLNSINPNDIKSFTVLKDASATAIYGSRASNGVIIITTKKSKAGTPFHVEYNGNVSVSYAPKFVDVLTGDQLRTMVSDLVQQGYPGLSSSAENRLGNANTDWQSEIYRTAISHDHNISFTGSFKDIPYRVSYGYTDQKGILKSTDMKRNTLAVNLNPSLLDNRLQINVSLKGMHNNNNFGNTGAVGSAVAFDPTQPVMNGNTKYGGYFTWTNLEDNLPDGSMNPDGYPNPIGVSNPVALINQTDNRSTVQRFIGNAQVNYAFKFLEGLKANLNTGYDYTDSKGHNNAPDSAPWTYRSGIGQKIDYTAQVKNELLDLYLNYVKSLGVHKFDVTAGYSWQHFWRKGSNFNRNGDGTQVAEDSKYINENYLVSFFGRLNYTLNDKYLFTFTLRDDGSSRFGPNNRWGLFPAAAFAWKINKEGFLADSKVVSDLKLRLGYGITGQQDISDNYYPYLALYRLGESTAQYQFGNQFYSTLRPNPYDANIKWESTTTYNVGLDFGFLNNRISGSIDAYLRKTSDLLNNIPIAAGTNFSNFLTTNVGDLENKGIEFSLDAKPVSTKDWMWDLGFNLSYNKNKITKLTMTDDPNYAGVNVGGIAGGVGNFIQNNQVGFPVNSFYVFQQVYDKNGKPIEGLYVDRSGQGGNVSSNNLNKYHYKTPAPDVMMGISSRLSYKQFDFSFSGRISLGNYVYNNVASDRALYSSIYNQSGFFNNVPTAIYKTNFSDPQYWSDYYVENASYFKMDNMSVGYNFDHFLTDKLKGRLSFTVQNAFTITDYSGLDPEVDGGIDNNIYPRPRTFLLGVNLSF
ncbi:TonB-dependent receptor [Prolixibacter sp. NT017]|uniref:SusC/RagA family TonB-linked outer membrane protein n=1 Tax=Prolixibacter sp. NT017 TaxID=2652390 RepID=UPI001272D362|nr:TonB-dependent receptor [Prolixibacter sp. NT017]GET27276.1 SusC/RagA family TonB-linked outer membrane protein [Prolixibacter sp. NT017]